MLIYKTLNLRIQQSLTKSKPKKGPIANCKQIARSSFSAKGIVAFEKTKNALQYTGELLLG